MTEAIQTKRDDATAVITIDRAADGNLLTIGMIAELAAAFRSAGAMDAQTALQLGIVSKVVAAEQLDQVMAQLVAALCGRSRAALVAVKDYMRSAPAMEPRGAADYAGHLLAAVLSSAQS